MSHKVEKVCKGKKHTFSSVFFIQRVAKILIIWRMTPKKLPFLYGKIDTSLNISIDWLQPTCRYQLGVSKDPHNFSLGLALAELV